MPARGYSVSAPRKPKAKARAKQKPAATIGGIAKQMDEARLRKQVAKARAKPPKADTGDITEGTRSKPKRTEAGGVSGNPIELLKGAVRTAGRAAKDIVELPVNVVDATYQNLAADYEAIVKGDTRRARRIYEGFRDHDPFALAAQGRFKEAGHEISAHPGNFAIEAAGVKGGVGRTTTKVQRKAGVKIPTREPRKVPGSPIETPRPYSEDAITRAVQVRREKRRVTAADTARQKADALEKMDAQGRAGQIAEERAKANKIDPRRGTVKDARVRAARTSAVQQNVSEANQAAVSRRVREATGDTRRSVRGRPRGDERPTKPTAAVALAAQNIARTPAELKAYRQRIVDTYPSLSAAERKAADATIKEIDKIWGSGATTVNVAAAARGYKDVMDPIQAKLAKAGIVPEKQRVKAQRVPYGVTQMEGVVAGPKGPMRPAPPRPPAQRRARVKLAPPGPPLHVEARRAAREAEDRKSVV